MKLRGLAMVVALVAAGLLVAAGPGTRLGLWQFRTGFTLLKWAAYLGIAAVVLGLIALVATRPRGAGVAAVAVALLLGAVAWFVPWRWQRVARTVPPIHDITTDPANPPEFVAVLPLRAGAPNPATYGGPEVAAAQERAYPDIRPLHLDAPPPVAFARALAAARKMGWEIVAADSGAGRIEATATTPWFGFKDDVVVRIGPDGSGSRIDVRSVSRVGKSDVGTNARRIRKYLEAVEREQ